LISSVIHRSRGGIRAATHSTPPADRLHPLLLEMKQAGEEACVIEASSHGLAQGRLDGVRFDCAVCTNLSAAHLDYHGTLAEYLHAKAELFRALPRDAVAILGRDDPTWELLREETLARVVTYGIEGGGDFRGRIVRLDGRGSELDVITPLGTVRVRSALVGRHNAANVVAAIAAAVALGAEPEAAAVGISRLASVPGRLERVPIEGGVEVFVDHAHTPEALEQVLTQLRPLTPRKLWVVFGCGGGGDRRVRPRMAAIAEELADQVVVTSDNPRSENPMAILRDLLMGFSEPRRVLLEPDRRQAIGLALSEARPGDLVLIAGKGHEAYQVVGDEVHPFDDRVEARSCLG
jgi:UDP-N-acetylmuramoyl-L-alanyl-D-glutamate--2,6-diaminopimelate ligase